MESMALEGPLVGDEGVAGLNPATPTRQIKHLANYRCSVNRQPRPNGEKLPPSPAEDVRRADHYAYHHHGERNHDERGDSPLVGRRVKVDAEQGIAWHVTHLSVESFVSASQGYGARINRRSAIGSNSRSAERGTRYSIKALSFLRFFLLTLGRRKRSATVPTRRAQHVRRC
jgi:hypothetical protein